MYSHRAFKAADARIVAEFPQSEEELFYFFPKAEFPLQPEVLLEEAKRRSFPIVVMMDQDLAGYGNFIHAEYGKFCVLGNVVVNPAKRKMGVASYLVETLAAIAFHELKARYVKISCFNNNTAGLLLYHKSGFVPEGMEMRQKRDGRRVALIHMYKRATGQTGKHL